MEKVHRLEQSTSSSFYEANKKSSGQLPKFQPIKSTFPQLVQSIENINDRTNIMQMQEQINLIYKKLRKCQQNISKSSEIDDIKSLIEKVKNQLDQAREKYLTLQKQVKQQIQKMLANLEKLLQNLKKQWERLRNKCEQELREEIQQIKTQKVANQTFLTSLAKNTGITLKQEINAFTQQLKQNRKNRTNKTSKIFAHLQAVRGNLNQLVAQQEAKRQQYNEIIYGLLQKTCQNAENALRRRVY